MKFKLKKSTKKTAQKKEVDFGKLIEKFIEEQVENKVDVKLKQKEEQMDGLKESAQKEAELGEQLAEERQKNAILEAENLKLKNELEQYQKQQNMEKMIREQVDSKMEEKMSQEKLTQKEMSDEIKEATQKKVEELEKQLMEAVEALQLAEKEVDILQKKSHKLETDQKQLRQDIREEMESKQQQMEEKVENVTRAVQKLQNDQKAFLDRMDKSEKGQKAKKKQQNCLDISTCDDDLSISGPNSSIVHCKGNGCFPVFAKYSIANCAVYSPGIFYFEINVTKMNRHLVIGLVNKQKILQLKDAIRERTPSLEGFLRFLAEARKEKECSYVYDSDGDFCIYGSMKEGNDAYGARDTVGCGVNLATSQLFFTKNGRRIDSTSDFRISASHSVDQLFPFASLYSSDDEIEANFGPDFLFNLSALSAAE